MTVCDRCTRIASPSFSVSRVEVKVDREIRYYHLCAECSKAVLEAAITEATRSPAKPDRTEDPPTKTQET